jgi:hypothetical protein
MLLATTATNPPTPTLTDSPSTWFTMGHMPAFQTCFDARRSLVLDVRESDAGKT